MAFSKKVALRPLFYLLIALFFGYLCYHSLAGDTILCASVYDGFFFFAANPIYTLALCCFVQRIWRKTITLAELGYLAMLCGSIVLFCLHKTMGGWQFGARYLVDSIPYLWLCALQVLGQASGITAPTAQGEPLPLQKDAYAPAPADWQWLLCALAVIFNVYGALYMLQT